MNHLGTVVAAHGRQYRIATDEGQTWLCFPRGKKSILVCGDEVLFEPTNSELGVISTLLPRRSLFYRSDAWKQRLIAANVTQVVIVVATEPAFSTPLITRCLIAAEAQDIATLIVLNKCDLSASLRASAVAALSPFASLGYRVIELSARNDSSPLRPHLAGHTNLLIGQSGMGKSTLTNGLLPQARAATREISLSLNTGKHTTTQATLYRLHADCALIDSPGLTEFGLRHLSRDQIEHGFIELRPLLGQCRFRDCRHDREPDCRLRLALQSGEIDARRFAEYRLLCAESG
ncbi:MAG TPA: ribosome small subunit-dependent GTPase A [Accumulibacter sp.]|nr:ribosome small subunit-dependent GTPase A [Accumulibacter sp.]HMW17496.1 ribosome small subunit-dependent GTPase A [Accumulibacter sp.]HMX21815.1 ribosome small subunit-dependent GTPase A [Accumulibacter sp.]HNC19107.1 ribosome small subunit-dependent GTPase A [Accumulibacter sp.]HND80044.1 ribosome small subunit-dependent GTPase A [Accumulibacter sp.]